MAQVLSRQLLGQARHLALVDPTRPQQGNLRRAVSAGYYALFHFLVEEANRLLLGATPARAALRDLLARAFTHTEMAATARTFAGGTLPAAQNQRLGAPAIPEALRVLANTFLDAQDQRHLADYDPGGSFSRGDVLAFIDSVELAIAGWPTIRDDLTAELFLISLLVWNRIRDK
jgi:hypothetical protein